MKTNVYVDAQDEYASKGEKMEEEEKEEEHILLQKVEKEERTSMKVSKEAYRMLITVQSMRQIEEKKRLSVSTVLCDALQREIERIRSEKR